MSLINSLTIGMLTIDILIDYIYCFCETYWQENGKNSCVHSFWQIIAFLNSILDEILGLLWKCSCKIYHQSNSKMILHNPFSPIALESGLNPLSHMLYLEHCIIFYK